MQPSTIRTAAYPAAIFAVYVAIAMLLPAAVDLYYGNKDWQVFVICSIATGAIALTIAAATRGPLPMGSTQTTFLVVVILWATLGLVGALPFYTASLKLDLAGSVFESVSAITTTGSTVITGLDGLPPGLLLWRSLLQWIGGIGVVALGLFLLPLLKVGGFSFFRVESSDIENRPFERFVSFLIALIGIYCTLTALCAIAYAAAGMNNFDAVNHAMTTIATGGFSTHDASFGYFAEAGLPMLWIGTIFMLVAGLPFSILVLFFVRGRLDALRDPQIRLFLAYVAVIVVALAVQRRITTGMPFDEALATTAFNFTSIITTTGFASEDYTLWGPFAVTLAFFATFLGGCSGSTAGGIKSYRFLILGRMLLNGLKLLIHPHSVQALRYGKRQVEDEMQRSVVLFLTAFLASWVVSTLLLAVTGIDFLTSVTASLTALTNVGPGLGDIVGPAGNFTTMSDFAKWVLSATMLLGRLEILAVIVLFVPTFWRS
ncbi:TrkH family potassium uptake protein [Nitratireductor indicus]|uniref:Trk system potassium uptake protein n=1 Tax=Nitratireductor indicus C115 TaxID=1231190 RepID=K2P9F7_9HYPH|nr:TrkH family potassium uptake protein [Nitratireductor indicus]EKF43821.1 cation transporter [Nitratireductor indicus C115]MDS1135411.1 TrkH family potassium uptake protein [Nitratireductor indicus]SFQ16203.1 trk system potassium uptake protein TrkH [Nitratireductor indicus]